MASFDENGKYIKTNWKAGDKITATKLNKIEESIEAVNDNDISRHVEADARLDALEAKDVAHDKEFTNVKNTIADNKAAAELGDYEINSRMTFLEDELNEGIEEVHNVASTVDGKIAQGKADMEAMVAEVEADLEGLHAKDEELSEQLAHIGNETDLLQFFGCVGDGVNDDTISLQNAINYCIENGVNMSSSKGKIYKLTKTILIPNNAQFNKSIDLTFNNNVFLVEHDDVVFSSASYIDGTLQSNYNTALESYTNFGVVFGDFVISTSSLKDIAAITLKEWHQGCVIRNISDEGYTTLLKSKNNYYCNFINLRSIYRQHGSRTGVRFLFEGSHNLCKFEKLVGANSDVIYKFIGGITASVMDNCSFEGANIGIEFNSEVYNMKIENSYFEGISDVYIKYTSYIDNLDISNNYFNFVSHPNCCVIDYTGLPKNFLILRDNNMFMSMAETNKLFKNPINTIGYSLFNINEKTSKIGNNELYKTKVDNTLIPVDATVNKEFISATGSFKCKYTNKKIVGNYVGSFTDGYRNGISGCSGYVVDDKTVTISTEFENIDTSLIYLNLRIPTVSQTFFLKCFISGSDKLDIANAGNMGVRTLLKNDKIEIIITSPTFSVGSILDGEIRLI